MSLVTEGGLDWDHDHAILMVSERQGGGGQNIKFTGLYSLLGTVIVINL